MNKWSQIPTTLLKTKLSPFDSYLELHPIGRSLRKIPNFYFKYRHQYPLVGETREIVDELVRRHYAQMVCSVPSRTNPPVASNV